MGADDYIAKPFSQRLLIARIRAILRRSEMRAGRAERERRGGAEEIVRGRLTWTRRGTGCAGTARTSP